LTLRGFTLLCPDWSLSNADSKHVPEPMYRWVAALHTPSSSKKTGDDRPVCSPPRASSPATSAALRACVGANVTRRCATNFGRARPSLSLFHKTILCATTFNFRTGDVLSPTKEVDCSWHQQQPTNL
jgi:hypothetical protein